MKHILKYKGTDAE